MLVGKAANACTHPCHVLTPALLRAGTKNGGAWENSIQSRSRFWRTPSPAAASALHSPAGGAGGAGDSTYSSRLARVQAEWLAAAPAQLPLVFVVCNGDPPAAGKPGLMTMADARTLFHEVRAGWWHKVLVNARRCAHP